MDHFGTPLGGAQVSSRLGESTVFKNSGGLAFGSHFGTILGPLWDPRGATRLAKRAQEGEEGGPKGGLNLGSFFDPPF